MRQPYDTSLGTGISVIKWLALNGEQACRKGNMGGSWSAEINIRMSGCNASTFGQ